MALNTSDFIKRVFSGVTPVTMFAQNIRQATNTPEAQKLRDTASRFSRTISDGLSNARRQVETRPQANDIILTYLNKTPSFVSRVASRTVNTPVLPFIPQSTPKNLFTRTEGTFGPLDPGSFYGYAAPRLSTQEGQREIAQELAFQFMGGVKEGGVFSDTVNALRQTIQKGITKSAAQNVITKPEAVQRLRNLVNYADDMKRVGYGVPGGRGAIPDVHTGIKLLAKELPQYYNKQAIDEALIKEAGTEGASWFNKMFTPLKALTPDLQEAVLIHRNKLNVAKIDADELARKFRSTLDPRLEWKLVQYSQSPTEAAAKALKLTSADLTAGKALIEQSRQFNDQLFGRARALGVDVNYLKNHIYQIFKESPDKVDDILAAKGLGKKPGFAQHRTIANFEEGMGLGLTPKYTTFAQLNAAAQESLEKAIANKNLSVTLEKSGQLLPQSQAPANWERINARWFPKANVRVGKTNTMIQDYYAPRQLATFLNNYFGGQQMGVGDKMLSKVADVGKVSQDILLSGGVGPLNFFGLGQLIKEGAAGRFITPLKAFTRALTPGASQAYQEANSGLIREMASEGIAIRGLQNYTRAFQNVVAKKSITEVLGDGWHKIMNEPTFGKFMNELQIGFYKDAKTALMNKGMADRTAQTLAAGATKKFYGLTESLGRARGVDDAITSVFLAPRYREGMLNIFSNLAQSLLPKNWSNAEYAGLRRLSVGMAMTYAMYNALQKKLTGNYMWDNPPGREFELVMPTGDPKDKEYVSVPWMPGFTALPRRILGTGAAALRGDPQEAKRQFAGLMSVPLSKGLELWANKDYFGRTIMREGSEGSDFISYAAKSFLPSYGRAVLDVASGRSTPLFGISQALELPIKQFTDTRSRASLFTLELKKLPKEQRLARVQALARENPEFYKEFKQYLMDQSLKLTGQEKGIRNLPVQNGARLTRIVKNLKAVKGEQRSVLWKRYVDTGIITPTIEKQFILYMKTKQEGQ